MNNQNRNPHPKNRQENHVKNENQRLLEYDSENERSLKSHCSKIKFI